MVQLRLEVFPNWFRSNALTSPLKFLEYFELLKSKKVEKSKTNNICFFLLIIGAFMYAWTHSLLNPTSVPCTLPGAQ